MPTYQYTCNDCGQPLEVVQAFTDDALTECPSCGGTLRKVYGAVGVVFKGSGFYRNDSRGSSSSSDTSSTSSTSTSSSDSSSTSASATPAPAPSTSSSSSSSSSGSSDAA